MSGKEIFTLIAIGLLMGFYFMYGFFGILHEWEKKKGLIEQGKRMKIINIMLDDGAYLPVRAHAADAGMDLFSPVRQWVFAGGEAVIDTGVHVEIPEGYVGLLKSKSGLNVKHGLVGEGVIDAGYTGSIVCKLFNQSKTNYLIRQGDKIIQLVILPIVTPDVRIVEKFSDTERGNKGFGSTGK